MREIASAPLTSYSPPDPRWALVLRVADSPHFRKGPKLRAFLLYVCENTLLGRLENVREQLIGSEVFGRPSGYNLSSDSIVRVEARELRRRLAAYFAEEGQNEPVVIQIPKGAYVPVFEPRRQSLPGGAPAVVEMDADEGLDADRPAEPVPSRPRVSPLLAAGLIITTAVAIWALRDNWRMRHDPSPVVAGAHGSESALYSDLLGALGTKPERQALLVLSNPKTLIYFSANSKTPLAEAPDLIAQAPKELKGTFGPILKSADRDLPFQFLSLNRQDYTGMGEAVSAFHIGRLMRVLNRPVRLTQGRFLNWDHVQKEDLIVLGGPASNDWTYQNDAKSNFTMAGATIENAKPQPGEQTRYKADSVVKSTSSATDYGILKMLTSPYGFKAFLLAGTSSAGTAGVSEFFSTPDKMRRVHERIRAAAPGKPFPPDWEVVVKVVVRDGVPVETSAVAVRPAPAPGR